MLNSITPHVYWLPPDAATDRPILGAIVGEQRTLIVDAGNSPAHANLLLGELSKLHIAFPDYLVLTHWHWDHVFGSSAFKLPTFASKETRRIVAEMARLDWSDAALDRRVEDGLEISFCRDMIKAEMPDRSNLTITPPDIAFDSPIQLDLGDLTCYIVPVGGDHSSDASIIYVEEDKIMFLGDCLYTDIYSGPPRFTTRKLFPLLDRLLSFDTDYYLAAHESNPMSRTDMVEYAHLLKTIGCVVEKIGPDRQSVLAALQTTFSQKLNDEHVEIADAFLAGLSKSTPPAE